MKNDTPLQVKVKNYMRANICTFCKKNTLGHSCIYISNSDEYMCDQVPLHLKILLNNEE